MVSDLVYIRNSYEKQKTIKAKNVTKIIAYWDAKAKKIMSEDNIYCKIELIKNPSTRQISLTAHLNPNAPNISTDEHTISWSPTFDERQFLIEAISLIHKQEQEPIVTFTKKIKNTTVTPPTNNSIDTINQKIDDLPYSKNQIDKQQPSKTIEQIIKQNIKEE
jgi:hypothetical protein